MNTVSVYGNKAKEFDLTAADIAFLCASPKGVEKTAKMIRLIISY